MPCPPTQTAAECAWHERSPSETRAPTAPTTLPTVPVTDATAPAVVANVDDAGMVTAVVAVTAA